MLMKHTATVRWQLWIVAFGFFMQTLDTTIVNTALPSMAASLGENPLRMQSVIVSYVLTVAVTLPASGWLADKVGVQRVFFSAIVLFTLGSLLCARSETLNELIASRVLQGVGGAMMVPVGRLTVMKIVPREQYMAAMTFVTLPGQIGPLMGPALGGFLVQYASWHWIFLINIPVGIVGAIATLLLMPNYQMQTRRFDVSGFLLLAIGMASLTLALDGHKGMGLSGGAIAGLVALGVAALLGYVWHAYGNSRALFSLRLLRTPTYKIGLLASLLGRIGSFVGLARPGDDLPCAPCVEIGWRLAAAHWGNGYAAEAARAALAYAFDTLRLPEVVSFTAENNQPSRRVMTRIGMQFDGETFLHPRLPTGHPLQKHVLYRLNRQMWRERHGD